VYITAFLRMFTPDESPPDPKDNKTYAQGRLPDRTYIHMSFPFPRENSMDYGQPARFVVKVFDTDSETKIEKDGEDWLLRETPGGRYQTRFLLVRDVGNIKEIWIERIPAPGVNGEIKPLLHLNKREHIERFFELVDLVRKLDPQGDETIRVDDGIIAEILASPDILKRLYNQAPERFRSLIEHDVSADDVYALASRRKAVEKFSRMLSNSEYFDSLIATEGSGKPEGVRQRYFEKNPLILGVSAASQLLTSLDPAKLEQVVRGPDLAGPGKRVDALMRTAGKVRSVVMIELKTHRTPLLASREYRSGCWAPSSEMVGGVTQSQCNVHWALKQLEERFQNSDDEGCDIPGDYSYLIKPRSLLLIGKLDELQSASGGDNRDKIRSFELFRRSTLEPEIVTFDELYAKALFIVEAETDNISCQVTAV
jgi:hypothetical protein